MPGDWQARASNLARTLLPRWLHSDYFLVRDLNARWENAETGACMPVLRERLRRVLVEAVGHVPHYRRGRISLEVCRNEDPFVLLQQFPFLTKEEVTSDPDSFVSERCPRWLRYRKTSNGSSGQSIVMWRTKRLADIEKAFLDHHWSRWGWASERSRILRIGMDSCRRIDEPAVRRLGNRLMVSPFHLTDRWLPGIYGEVQRFAPEFIYSYPSCAAELARFILQTEAARKSAAISAQSPVWLAGKLCACRRAV
jgi:phenylacetate-CoA ligase